MLLVAPWILYQALPRPELAAPVLAPMQLCESAVLEAYSLSALPPELGAPYSSSLAS